MTEQAPLIRTSSIFKITTLKAILLIAIVGIVFFFSGLSNQFVNDDHNQIVDALPVHSIANIKLFFQGGTFYNGQGLVPLSGTYYRPIMTTTFAGLYTLFGANPFAFHAFQLLLHIIGTIMLFLIFKYFFKPELALALALIFLIHPINSQAVFAIAAMQEPLYFVFGIIALWILVRTQGKSLWYLIPASTCLFLSLMAKEAGILFVVVALMYTLMSERRRFYTFAGLSALYFSIYLAIKVSAVGFLTNPHLAPIDEMSIWGRLLNVPAMVQFYFTKFMFPVHLAHYYYWAYDGISIAHFIVPLFVVLGILSLMFYLGFRLKRKAQSRHLTLYIFFSIWLLIGLVLHLQLIPLDLTVGEAWFYFPMVGLLGMIGVILDAFPLRLPRRWILLAIVGLVVIFGSRTFIRGFDWSDQYTLASRDIKQSQEDYISATIIAEHLAETGNPSAAKPYAERSVNIYPSAGGYATLGLVYAELGDYQKARQQYVTGLKTYDYAPLTVGLASIDLFTGDTQSNIEFVESALKKYPTEAKLWFCLAVLDARSNQSEQAKQAITKARALGFYEKYVFDRIMNNEPFSLNLSK